jgi:basic membrane lipoprotein Med (substrate-binding protein (PBP1-ABC) superfamily)
MTMLEQDIAREQAYIAKHGEANDAGEYDEVWEEYKENAARNLEAWDQAKKERDRLKREEFERNVEEGNIEGEDMVFLTEEEVEERLKEILGDDYEALDDDCEDLGDDYEAPEAE